MNELPIPLSSCPVGALHTRLIGLMRGFHFDNLRTEHTQLLARKRTGQDVVCIDYADRAEGFGHLHPWQDRTFVAQGPYNLNLSAELCCIG